MEVAPGDASIEAGSGNPVPAVPEPVKPRLKRPVKPDKEEHLAAVNQLQTELDKRRTRSDTLKQQIEQKRQPTASPEVQELRNKQNAVANSFRSEVDKKTTIREKLKALNASRDELRNQSRDQKGKLGACTTVQKLNERIHALEHRTNHTTMEWKDEQKAREEIKRTEALRPVAERYEANQNQLKASEKERESLLEQIKSLDGKIDGIKVQRENLEKEMAELRQRDAAKTQDVPAMIKEKDECREVMNALWEKIQQLRADFKVKNNEFWEESKVFKEQQNQERAERAAQREKEYQDRQAERKAAAAEFAGEPYHKEVGLCEQLLIHLSKYTQQAQTQAAPSTTATAKDSTSAFEGMKAVSKGNKIDDEFGAFMGSASKKGKGKKGKPSSGSQTQSSQKLNHSLDMIDAFHKLKVSVPTTTDKVPAAREEVQASKDYWLKKRQEAKDSGVMPEEPSTSTANGVAKPAKAAKQTAPTSFNFSDQEFPGIPGHIGNSDEAKDKSTEQSGDETITAEAPKDAPLEPESSAMQEQKEISMPSTADVAKSEEPSIASKVTVDMPAEDTSTAADIREESSKASHTDLEPDVTVSGTNSKEPTDAKNQVKVEHELSANDDTKHDAA